MKRGLCIAVCIAVILCGLFVLDNVLLLKRWDGVTPMRSLYAQKRGTVDVLLMGSSNAGVNLDAETLWTEYGIAASAVWGPMQPFWNTYYVLKEVLRTQHPRAVVLDVYAAKLQEEYQDETRALVNLLGMRRGRNRFYATQLSLPKERRRDALLGFPIYHARYAELTREDFEFFPWSEQRREDKGTSVRYGTYNNTSLEYPAGMTMPMTAKEEEWLGKIVKLCETENISLILIKTPVTDRVQAAPYYHGVEQYAARWGVPYYDYNTMDEKTGITAADYWTDGDHLNTEGARKVTRLLAENLRCLLEIPDRRGEQGYESWDRFAESMQTEYLRRIQSLHDYLSEINRQGRIAILILPGDEVPADLKVQMGTDRPGIYLSDESGNHLLQEITNGFGETVWKDHWITADFQGGNGVLLDGKCLYRHKLMDTAAVLIPISNEKAADLIALRKGNAYHPEHRLELQ